MSDKMKPPVSELMEEAMKNYEQALQAGLKLQEECSNWWTEVMTQNTTPADWQKRFKAAASQTIPIVQKRMEESLQLIEQSSRTSLELFKQAMAVNLNDSAGNVQAKLQELWEASLGAVRSNAQAVSQANAKFVASWMQLLGSASKVETSNTKRG
jgi:hypothetical protein